MKTNVKNIAIALFTITMLWSCKKEPIVPLHTNDDVKYMQVDPGSFLTNGSWVVTTYDDGSQVRPSPLSSLKEFTLRFNEAHVVIGTNPEKSFIGKWNYIIESRHNQYLVIDFGAQPLILMNNKWQTLGQTATGIKVTGFKNGKPVNMAMEQVKDNIDFK